MKRRAEKVAEGAIAILALSSLLALLAIMAFLFKEGAGVFGSVSLREFFLGKVWLPTYDPPEFGILPLVWGSLTVTFGAIVWSAPMGIGLAIYLAEVASPRLRSILKPTVEILAGIPSVVFGFFGMVILGPLLQRLFGVPTGLCALNASILLGIMALPTIVSLSEDALSAVPRSLKEASLALGATPWQTIRHVCLPVASGGITSAVILGLGRAIGETMTVLMVAGNAPVITISFLEPIRTLTATIALEMAEVVKGSPHYHALFAIGGVLFLISMVFNVLADFLQEKWRRKLR